MAEGALAGVRVLNVAGPVAAYCTRILADLGADVVMVEPPGGDRLRRVPPFVDGARAGDDSLLFGYYHAGQRAVTLDLDTHDGRRRLAALGAAVDVVIVSPSPRQPLPGWDFSSQKLDWAADGAIVCALTPFGLTGPHRGWRATSMTSFAMGGNMIRVGPVEGPPVTIPGRQQWDEAGTHAALAVLAALHARPRAGGQLVDLAVHELAAMRDLVVERYSAIGMDPAGRTIPAGIPPTGTFQCADGPFNVACHQRRHWDAFLEMVSHPHELSEPAFADPMVRREMFDGVRAVIERLVAGRSREELVERGQRAGLPCSVQYTPAEFVTDPQLAARGAFVPTPIARGGTVAMPGPGFHAEPPLTIERPSGPAAPTRGDAADLGWAPRPACSTPAGGRVVPGGPLEGVRVLSFGAFIAGATVGCLLAELGADVVKIEARSHPEVLRTPAYAIGRTFTEPSGVPNTLMYASFNRSVRNLSLEMGTEDGRALFRRLAAGVDVVIENFGTGVLDRWGCGFDALLEMNPRVVLTSLSGYGRTGPRAAHLAYASNISSFAALTYAWGGHSHTTHSDYIAGQHAAVATLAALRQAHATGRGVHVDVAQTEAMTAVMPGLLLDALVNRRNVPPPANRVAGSLLSGAYRALGYDAWLAIELEDLGDWNKACSVVGRGDLAITAAAAGRRNDLDAAIAEWCARRTSHTGAHLLQRAGVAAGVVQTAEDVCRDPQLRSRGYFVELDQPDLGRYEHWANPYRFSVTRPGPSRAAPRLGGHTKALLREWLQIADEEIDSLITSGVVFQG